MQLSLADFTILYTKFLADSLTHKLVMQVSMLSPTPPSTGIVGIWWGFDLVRSQIPHRGDDSQKLIPTY